MITEAASTEAEPGITYDFAGFNGEWTAWAMVKVFYIIGYSITSSFLSGEIKNVRRAQIFGMPVSVVFTTIMMALLVFAFLGKMGYEWLGALGWVGELNPAVSGLDFTPAFAELAGVMSGSALLGVLAVFTFIFWTYVWLPIDFLASSRAFLTWSFDRLLPEAVADVNPRMHTPTEAILVIAVLGEISLLLFSFHVIDSIVGIFGWVLSFVILGTEIPGWVPHIRVPVLAGIAYLIIKQSQQGRGIDVWLLAADGCLRPAVGG